MTSVLPSKSLLFSQKSSATTRAATIWVSLYTRENPQWPQFPYKIHSPFTVPVQSNASSGPALSIARRTSEARPVRWVAFNQYAYFDDCLSTCTIRWEAAATTTSRCTQIQGVINQQGVQRRPTPQEFGAKCPPQNQDRDNLHQGSV